MSSTSGPYVMSEQYRRSVISFPMFLFLCFVFSCLVICVPMLVVGVANGNIEPHIPTWHAVGQAILESLVD